MRCLFILLFFISASVFAAQMEPDLNIPASESSDDDSLFEPEAEVNAPSEVEQKTVKPVIKQKAQPPSIPAVTPVEKAKPDGKAEEEKPKTEELPVESNLAVLQGLNKVMGRVYTIEAPLGIVSRFENLEIIVRRCLKTRTYGGKSSGPLENAAFMEIRELKAGEEPKHVFLGWMFASSPSLSAIEHPVYDVTVLSCEARADPEGAEHHT